MSKNKKRILGLDIGSNSIGFQLLNVEENGDEIIFEDIVGNSIIFSSPNSAEDRRAGRSSRRVNERKSQRNKNARRTFIKYGLADSDFIENTTNYLNALSKSDPDVYRIRERAIEGEQLTKDDFLFSTYSILTDRGYNNMFSTDEDSEEEETKGLNNVIENNKKEYLRLLAERDEKAIPSLVLTQKRKELSSEYHHTPVRNKKGNYSNSLDRGMHKEEFIKVVMSQADNKELFKDRAECESFVEEMVNETVVGTTFYQRPLKSLEGMIEYCSFYDKFNLKGSHKRGHLCNVTNIELTLRQRLDNSKIINTSTGELAELSREDIDKVVDYWIESPSAQVIHTKNILKNAGFKELSLFSPDKTSETVLDIKAHIPMAEVLGEYSVDYKHKDSDLYNSLLDTLHHYKNASKRKTEIEGHIARSGLELDETFVEKISSLKNMDGFASFSTKFAKEVLEKMKSEELAHDKALASLGYASKYLNIPTYDYLPPLNPTKADIKWVEENIPYFKTEHLFYNPMISPKVKRVLGILRKLVNKIIAEYGKIDEIRIETAGDGLRSAKEIEKGKDAQARNEKKNKEAKKFLSENELPESGRNVEVAKLFIEQNGICLYSGTPITVSDAFVSDNTEVEHFIPRSKVYINSQKNKILVLKKHNQDKESQHPVSYLQSIGEWENFKERVGGSSIPFNKKKWLTDEDVINSAWAKEDWLDSYLNDTRTAVSAIQKYLTHYLFPSESMYNKGGTKHILSVSGKAVSELKHMWGISGVMPKDENDKKDRSTSYHHTLDAFTVALCSNSAINTLHSHFKAKETHKFKNKALKEKLNANVPKTKEGEFVSSHLAKVVKRYESNELYVCPVFKKKTNQKGFKDGNLKLVVVTDPKNKDGEILTELETINIDSSLLIKIVGGFIKGELSDVEVRKEISSIQSRLHIVKQQKIIEALPVYAEKLIELRERKKSAEDEQRKIEKQKKNGKTDEVKVYNAEIEATAKPFKVTATTLAKDIAFLECFFLTKTGKKQLVRKLKLHREKLEQSKADAIIFPSREIKTIERLSVDSFKSAKENKEPFVLKANDSTHHINIYSDEKQGQLVGLCYFSGERNPEISPKVKKGKTLANVNELLFSVSKGDMVGAFDIEGNLSEAYTSNGGGNISSASNKININKINRDSMNPIPLTLSKKTLIKKIKIDFFGKVSVD